MSDFEQPTMTCPKCRAELPDFDGFGVLAHTKPAYPDGCGYCTHPSRDGDVCGICGDVRVLNPVSAVKPARIRVLSLWQPWASLWVAGTKMNETRSWATDYRGIVAVHAGLSLEGMECCHREPFAEAIAVLGFESFSRMPRGALLGTVNLVGCTRTEDVNPPDLERALGDYAPGRWAWRTGEARTVLPEPIWMRGGQGLRWLADDIRARLP